MMKKISYGLMYIMAAVWLIPLVWTVWTAFRPKRLALSSSISIDFTLSNFTHVWNAAPFSTYYLNTIVIVAGVFTVQFLTVSMAAFAFARVEFWGKSAIFLLFLAQIMIPADILIFPNYTVLRDLSLLDTKLGIMIPYFASAFGVFLLRQMFKTIPFELDEAARMEGCSLWQILWRIYMPLARPAYVSFGLVSVSYHWNNFLWPLIITNSVENRPLTVGLAIFAQSFETGAQWSEVTAATMLVILPLLLGFMVFQRQFMNSFIHSGIK
ncbi:carbohydrate ABC transporter permease [Paenibacillus sp. 1011MAR3C5]|uniref:carbohydrate ABC transporter permease n=1 Tax=Paenibacillus sp. 1011MAR3C5 TaxID=1675787 RepID=UPI000E6C90D6|nr:carbohydrate ABC transporter permease [Paenibacillus sp. 1011MAR3C5]RJE87564.1 carbohydrate ABC transporter permease [Paenibacillus sp. 1011MAR3C5]